MADRFDPIAIVRALQDGRVSFMLIGHMAQVANGSPLGFSDVEITYPIKDDNVERLVAAVRSITDDPTTVRAIDCADRRTVATRFGALTLTPTPPGTRGYDDLRRKAQREHIARGLRAHVADVRDLVRMENAGDGDRVRSATLQRIGLHLSRQLDVDR
jgi:hypothetical protein